MFVWGVVVEAGVPLSKITSRFLVPPSKVSIRFQLASLSLEASRLERQEEVSVEESSRREQSVFFL